MESFAYLYSAQMSCEAPGEAGRAVYRDRGGDSADATRDSALGTKGVSEGRRAYLLVNNRSERNVPLMVQALSEMLHE